MNTGNRACSVRGVIIGRLPRLWHWWSRRWLLAGAGFAVASTAACGGSEVGGGSNKPTTSPSASPTVSASASSDLGHYPAHATPLSSAPALSLAWSQAGILQTIPGSDIFAKAPPMPAVVNHTNGAVSDADARAMEVAFWRAETLNQWAQANKEGTFIAVTLLGQQEGGFFVPDAQTAMNDFGTVIDPNCDMFPTAFEVWPRTAAVDSWIGAVGYHTAAPGVLIVPFTEANCLLAITDKGKVSAEPADPTDPHGVDRVVWVGEVVPDGTVGPYFKVEASSNCDRAGAAPAMCNARLLR